MKKKLLVLGGTGLIGSTLVQNCISKFEIQTTSNQNKSNFKEILNHKINFLNESERLSDIIKLFKPDFIVHTVAFPSVDYCENHRNEADYLHVKITEQIAKICREINAKMILISTDAVFQGKKEEKFSEEDLPNPINYYGKTRLEAEKKVLAFSDNNIVLRTSVVYGWHKKSRFTNWIIDSLKEGKKVDPHIDQYNTPTLVDDLVNVIIRMLEQNKSGLYHATGKTCLNRFEFALKIANHFNLKKDLIFPVTAKEKIQEAPRPFASCLDSTKIEKIINYNFKNIDEGIKFILNKSKI
jgi:dTDP-4-dehydrorhamnose reductase